MSENKKLTQLPEKLTSLDPNDLLYVSTNGLSKSIKASTIEAPLKTYANNKASEAQSAAISAANSTAQSLVNAETSRATSAESGLQNQIASEISNRIAADSNIQSSINVESSRAVSAESSLQNQITQEVSDRQAAVFSEEQARISADSSLQTLINNEESARIAGDSSILSESKLYTDNKVSLVLSNLDTESLDSLVEVVDAFEAADENLNNAISNLVGAATTNLNTEISAREAANLVLQQNIDAENTRAVGVENSLQSAINSEEVARIAEDLTFLKVSGERAMAGNLNMGSVGGLEVVGSQSILTTFIDEQTTIQIGQAFIPGQTAVELYKEGVKIWATNSDNSYYFAPNYQLIAENFSFTYATSTLSFLAHEEGNYTLSLFAPSGIVKYKVINLANGISESDAVNKSQLDSETSRAELAEQSLQNAITLEVSRALAAESSLNSQISGIQSGIDFEASRAIAAEGSLQSQINNILSNVDPIALDSLTEVVTAFQASDLNLSGAIITLANNNTDSLNNEITARSAADASLQSQIDDIETSLTSTITANAMPVGVIQMFAGTVAPSGYLLCDGSAVSRSTYSALFSVIGTTYGVGNDSTTFNLPNPDSNANIKLIIKI